MDATFTITSHVASDGSSVVIEAESEGCVFRSTTIPYAQLPWVEHEIRTAGREAAYRRRCGSDKGAGAKRELLEAAIAPTAIEVFYEPETSDRLLMFHFEENSPLVIRMSPERVIESRTKMARVERETGH